MATIIHSPKYLRKGRRTSTSQLQQSLPVRRGFLSWNDLQGRDRRFSVKENWVSSTPHQNWGGNSGWLGGNQRRGSTGGPTPGRHIPRRKSLDIDQAGYKLKYHSKKNVSDSDEGSDDDDVFTNADDGNKEYRSKEFGETAKAKRRLACLSEGASERPIFSYNERKKTITDQQRFSGNEKDIMIPEMTYRRFHRVFPKNAERILDLPKFEDNFFTHTIDWWTDQYIVTALDKNLFICFANGQGAISVNTLEAGERYAAVAVNETKRQLVCGTTHGQLELWDLNTKKILNRLSHPHKDTTNCVWPLSECRLGCFDWRPDEWNILVSGCRNGQIDTWDTRILSKGPVNSHSWAHTQGTICSVKHNFMGKYFASGDSGSVLKVWDVTQTSKPVFDKRAHNSSVRAMCWHPNEPYVLLTGGGIDDGYLKLWNIMRYQEPILKRNVKAQMCSIIFSPLTNEIYSSQFHRGNSYIQNHRILVWSYPEMKKIGNLLGHVGRVLHLGLNRSQTVLASAAGDQSLRIWNIAKTKRESTSQLRSTLALGSLR